MINRMDEDKSENPDDLKKFGCGQLHISNTSEGNLADQLISIVTNATKQGLSASSSKTFQQLLHDFIHAFQVKMSKMNYLRCLR